MPTYFSPSANNARNKQLSRLFLFLLACLLMFASVSGCTSKKHAGKDSPKAEPQALLDEAVRTLDKMARADDIPSFVPYLSEAKGIMIFPSVIKGSWLLGVEVGRGVMLTQNSTGWSAPVFVETGKASFGFQAGGQQSEIILLLMNDSYTKTLLQGDKLQASVDLSMAAGTAAHDNDISYDTHTQGIVYIGKTKGLIFDASLGGGGISTSTTYNQNYYGPDVELEKLVKGNTTENGTLALRNRLEFYTDQTD